MFLKKIFNSKGKIATSALNINKSIPDLFKRSSNFSYSIMQKKNFYIFKFNKNFLNNYQKKYFSENIQQTFVSQEKQLNVENHNKSRLSESKYFKDLFDKYLLDETYHEIYENKFDVFLDKFEKLMHKEQKRIERNENFSREIRQISIQSREPLRDVLVHYEIYRNQYGLDPEAVSQTILVIGKIVSSQGRFHKCYTDLSHWELINSVRFFNLVEDIKNSLQTSISYMNGEQLKNIIRGLKLTHYKNTELAEMIHTKLSLFINNKMDEVPEKERYSDIPATGRVNYHHINQFALKFREDKNFKNYLEKLMKIDIHDEKENLSSVTVNLEKNRIIDIENNLNEIVTLMQSIKDIQFNFTDNVSNLLNQYFRMEQALIVNKDILENPYLKFSLLRIQEKFIDIGFINIDTYRLISSKILSESEISNLIKDNLHNILKDYIYVNYPDVFSNVIDIIENTRETKEEKEKFVFTKFRISMINVSECLAELSDYSKITNVDINGDDYLNKNLNLDYHDKEIPETPIQFIRTIPQYTKLYNKTLDLFKSFNLKKFTEQNNFMLKFYSNLIYSYANLNLDCKILTDYAMRYCGEKLTKKNLIFDNEDISLFLYSFALSGYPIKNKLLFDLINSINLNNLNELSFDSTVKLLWALLASNYLLDDKVFSVVQHLNQLEIKNHITEQVEYYNNVDLFYQVTIALREYSRKNKLENEAIKKLLTISNKYFENKSAILKREDLELADPLKSSFMEFFIEKFIKKKFDYDHLDRTKVENNVEFQKLMMPFTPDFILNIYGNKLCLFLNSLDKKFYNTEYNGQQKLIKLVLENYYNCTCVFISISEILSFDHENLKISVKKRVDKIENFENFFIESIKYNKPKSKPYLNRLMEINYKFKNFISKIVDDKSPKFELLLSTENKENLEVFFKSVLLAVELYEKIIYNSLFNEFESNLIELKKLFAVLEINYSSLSENFRVYVEKILTGEITNVTNLKKFLKTIINENEDYFNFLNLPEDSHDQNILIDQNWVGKRLNIDLINTGKITHEVKDFLNKKNIAVEILNNNYMWFDAYNPYADWEEELKSNFDNFNYFPESSNYKYYFNTHKLGNRKVAKGIFPHPSKFRVMRKKFKDSDSISENTYENELNKYMKLNEILIKEEIKKNNIIQKEKLPNQLSMKINLLNINNSLKQNFTDNEIIRFISQFEFTDKLIEEFLNEHENEKKNVEFVSRNPEEFKNFNTRLDNIRDHFDEYDKYIMKEYYKSMDLISYDKSKSPEQIKEDLEGKMKKKYEELNDDDALSIHNPNEIDYKFNIHSIINNISNYKKDSLLSFTGYEANLNNEIKTNPEKFVEFKRKISERNLILFKIIIKTIQNKHLNDLEKKYLVKINRIISDSNLVDLDKKTVNKNVTNLQIKHLSANDLYSLNTLGNVEIKDNLFEFSLSDLILELNNFFDNQTFNKIIFEMFSIKKSNEFSLKGENISLFDTDNKEPILLNQEIKETIWRISGFFNELDLEKLKNFLRIKRGKSSFDKFWLSIDEASLEEFIKEINLHENRVEYLEKWIKRKESEYENRINLPPDNLKLTDGKINILIEKKDKLYRKKLLENVFKTDDIKTISPRAVNQFINEFVEFLPLYNFNFPQIISDLFNALEDLQKYNNIYNEDLEMLNSYKNFFKIEEENPNEFLATQPIKLNQERIYNFSTEDSLLNEDKLLEKIKNSTIPFVKNISNLLIENY